MKSLLKRLWHWTKRIFIFIFIFHLVYLLYCNMIEMGDGVFGIETATQHYFHKPAKKLTANEAAMIAASLPNPKRYTVKPVSRWVARRSPWIVNQMNHLRE